MHNGSDVVARSGHIDHLHKACVYAIAVEVFFFRFFYIVVLLAEHCKNGVLQLVDVFKQAEALFSADKDRGNDAWEQHQAACGKYWHRAFDGNVEKFGVLVVVVGNHLD